MWRGRRPIDDPFDASDAPEDAATGGGVSVTPPYRIRRDTAAADA
jgi:hypothetical protein